MEFCGLKLSYNVFKARGQTEAEPCFGCRNVPLLKPEGLVALGLVSPLNSYPRNCFCVQQTFAMAHLSIPRQTSSCLWAGMTMLQNPKPNWESQRQSPRTHTLWAHFCGVLLWQRIRQSIGCTSEYLCTCVHTTLLFEHYFIPPLHHISLSYALYLGTKSLIPAVTSINAAKDNLSFCSTWRHNVVFPKHSLTDVKTCW